MNSKAPGRRRDWAQNPGETNGKGRKVEGPRRGLPRMAPVVKNLRPGRETEEMWAPPLGPEGSLEKAPAVQSGLLAWRIPGTEEPGRLQSMGSRRATEAASHTCV